MEHDRESRCGREPIKKKKKSRDITLANMKTAPAKFSEFPFKEAYSFIILVFDDI